MAAYTTVADGNIWSSPSTWTPTAPSGGPASGDTVTIEHNTTYDSLAGGSGNGNGQIGDDNVSVGYAIAWGAGSVKTLTIANGCTLRCKGNISNPSGTWGCLNVAAGGTFYFYPANGATNVYDIEYVGLLTCNGVSGNRAIFGADLSRGSGNSAYMSGGGNPGLYQATYADFYNLGNASQYGLFTTIYSESYSSGDNIVENCTFHDSGYLPAAGSSNINFFCNNNIWYGNTPGQTTSLFTNFTISPGTATRTITNNVFLNGSIPSWNDNYGLEITECYFDSGITANDIGNTWSSFNANLIRLQVAREQGTCGDCINNFWINDEGANDGFALTGLLNGTTYTFDSNVYQYDGTEDGNINYAIGYTEGSSGSLRTINVLRNILLPNLAGLSSGVLVIADTEPSESVVGNIYHNTCICGSAAAIQITRSSGSSELVGSIGNVKANLFYSAPTPSPTYFALTNTGTGGDITTATGAVVVDVVTGSDVDYNAVDGLTTVSHNFWLTSPHNYGSPLTGTGIESGTAYNTPMSGSTVPGTHDLNITSSGTQFVDSTRNIETWSVHKGYATSGDSNATKKANALTQIQANTSLIGSDLLPWIRAGFVTNNSVLNGATYPGDTLTTDASGNTLNGTIGAMAYSAGSGAATTYTVSLPSSGDLNTAINGTVTANGTTSGQTVTLVDDRHGNPDAGVFSPSTINLNNTTPVAFTYTPYCWSTRSITGTNSGSLSNPSATTFLAKVQLGFSGTNSTSGGAAGGNIAPMLGGFNIFGVGPYWAELSRNISSDPVDYQSDMFFGLWLSRSTIVSVSLTSNVATLTTLIPHGYSSGATIEVSDLTNTEFNGTWTLSGVTANTFSFALTHGNVSHTKDYGYACLHTLLHVDFVSTASGTTAFGQYGMPHNIVAGTQSTSPISYTEGGADAGTPVPIPYPCSFEGVPENVDPPTTPPAGGVDRHCLIAVRNETTGGIDHILEFYQIYYNTGTSSWISEAGAKFDVAGGIQRLDNGTLAGADAAGLPIYALTLRCEDVLRVLSGLSSSLGYPPRATFPGGLFSSWQVWPALDQQNAGYVIGRLPTGQRVRLKNIWYEANKGFYSGQARVILDAMYEFGVINADITGGGFGSGFFLEGNTDDRWDADNTGHGIYSLSNIPMSAFEVPYIQPQFSLTGPAFSLVGITSVLTLAKIPSNEQEFGADIYSYTNKINTGLNLISNSTPTGTTGVTATSAGTYSVAAISSGPAWYTPTGPTINIPSNYGDHQFVITALASTVYLSDTFSGASGDIASHTSDSNNTWANSGQLSLNGTGSISLTGTYVERSIPVSSWVPQSANYAVRITIGLNATQNSSDQYVGARVRMSGSAGSQIGYEYRIFYDSSTHWNVSIVKIGASDTTIGNTTFTLASANDVFEFQITGSSTTSFTVLQNNTSILTASDSSSPITAAGSVGLVNNGAAGGTDQIRSVRAGAIGSFVGGIK